MKPIIICLVDDDDIYQFTFTQSLKKVNIAKRIMVFSNAYEALDFLQLHIKDAQDIPDVVFLDINMPVMDGWEFLEEYTKMVPNLPKQVTIYMVSSSVNKEDIDRAKSISEVTDYLIKPVEGDAVKGILDKLQPQQN